MIHRIYNAGSREANPMDVDMIRVLSDEARATRRPGQTLQARLNELRDIPNYPTFALAGDELQVPAQNRR